MSGIEKRYSTKLGLSKKEKKFSIKAKPGRKKEGSLPIGYILRDMLNVANNLKEAKAIINKGLVYLDGKRIKDYKTGCGIFDIISVGKNDYQIVFNEAGKLNLNPTNKKTPKLCKITKKYVVKGNKIMIGTHDGRVFAGNKEHKVGDTIKLDINSNKILGKIEFRPNAKIVVIKGKYAGNIYRIKEINEGTARAKKNITICDANRCFKIPADNIFVVE